MRVLFLACDHPVEQLDFTRALAQEGAEVHGLGVRPQAALPDSVKPHLARYAHVPELFAGDVGAVVRAAGPLHYDRVLTNFEPCVVLAAQVREALGVRGMSVHTALGFRDKQVMKERVRAAGLRVPRSARVRTVDDAVKAAQSIGFPLVIKPVAGAGSADTWRCDDVATLKRALATMLHVAEASVEEFIQGDEFTYDTVCVDGTPVFESVSQYHPQPIQSRNEEWISPQQRTFRDPYLPRLLPGIELGRGVLRALGMTTGFTHMEWFLTPSGEAVLGEIGSRSGGAHLVDMMNVANDFDVYRGWAQAVLHGHMRETPSRQWHCGMTFKRAEGQGRIQRIEGRELVHQACGDFLVSDALLPIGAPRRNWKATLLSDGFIVVKHPDEQACRDMMNLVATKIRMYAG